MMERVLVTLRPFLKLPVVAGGRVVVIPALPISLDVQPK